MPLICDACGHIHWAEAPQARATFKLVRERKTLTARQLSEAHGIRIQAASNRLVNLAKLGVIELMTEQPVERGGVEKVWKAV